MTEEQTEVTGNGNEKKMDPKPEVSDQNKAEKRTEAKGKKAELKKESEENKKADLWIEFKIEVPGREIEKQIDEIARKYSTDVKLPGFRKGKVPTDMVRNIYKDAISSEALNEVVEHFIYDKVRQENIRIIPPPVIVDMDYEEGGDLKADVRVEVFPQIELPKIEEIRAEIPKKDLQPKPFNEAEQIDALLEAHKRRTLVKDRGVQENDIVSIVYQSKILETKRMTPKKESEYKVDKATEFEILNLYEEVLDKKANEKIVFKRTYPADYHKKAWAGKEIEHYVMIENINQLVKPKLDKEFLKTIGFDDEEGFKKKLNEEYNELAKKEKDDIIIRSIINKIMEVADFPVPQTLVEKELQRMMPPDSKVVDIKEGDPENEYFKLMSENAKNSVKSMLVFDHIRREFKIEVTNEDLEKEYKQVSERTKFPLGEIRRYYSNSEQKEQLKENLLNRKLLEFLKEKVKVKEI